MIDYRNDMPQALAGGSVGLPCARMRFEKPGIFGLPKKPLSETPAQLLRSGQESQTAFAGTRTMTTLMGQSRSTGCLHENSVLQRVMRSRTADGFDDLVEVLVSAMGTTEPEDFRAFPGLTRRDPHRRKSNKHGNLDWRRAQVLRALGKYPLCDLYDLARCSPAEWSKLSSELGGISHGIAMRIMFEYVQCAMPASSRASFWVAAGPTQSPVEQGRQCSMPGPGSSFPRKRRIPPPPFSTLHRINLDDMI